MKDRWDYSKATFPERYGDILSYKKAFDFLDGDVEDWGCGTTYAKQYARGKYTGVDGSKSKFSDVYADLREYKSSTPNLLMRHILEHNDDWEKILDNALNSFTKRMALIIYTPFVKKTHNASPDEMPEYWFKKTDLTSHFNCKWTEEILPHTNETIFYLEK